MGNVRDRLVKSAEDDILKCAIENMAKIVRSRYAQFKKDRKSTETSADMEDMSRCYELLGELNELLDFQADCPEEVDDHDD